MASVGAQSALEVGAPPKVDAAGAVRRFDELALDPEARKRLEKHVCVDALLTLRERTKFSTLVSRCCHAHHGWEASARALVRERLMGLVAHTKQARLQCERCGPASTAAVAVGASDRKILLVYRLDELSRQVG